MSESVPGRKVLATFTRDEIPPEFLELAQPDTTAETEIRVTREKAISVAQEMTQCECEAVQRGAEFMLVVKWEEPEVFLAESWWQCLRKLTATLIQVEVIPAE